MIAYDGQELLYECWISRNTLHFRPKGNGRVLFSVVWWKISSEETTNSLNFLPDASEPGGTWTFRTRIEGNWATVIARISICKEKILHAVNQNLNTSVRALAFAIGRSRTNVHRVLQDEALHPFKCRECIYYNQMIIHKVPRSHNGFLTKVRQTCTFQVPCYSVMKQSFHTKGCLIHTTHTCGS